MSRRGDSYRGRRQGPLNPEQVEKARAATAARRRRPFSIPMKAVVSMRPLEAHDCLPADVARWRQTWAQLLEEQGEIAVSYIEPVAKRWPRNCAAEGAHLALKSYNENTRKERERCQTKPTE